MTAFTSATTCATTVGYTTMRDSTCQNVVRDNLRSPSTADFVGFPEVNGSIITGQVDAQNGFGATVRSSFQCTIVSPERVRLDFLE